MNNSTTIENTNSSSVDEVLNMIESSNDIDDITNEILIQSILNKPTQTETTKIEVAKVIKTPKTSTAINYDSIILPTGVIRENKPSFIKFSKDAKKIVIKKSLAELNTIIENLDANIHILTKDEIQKKHLGTMKATLKIENSQHLQNIINSYFA